MRKILIRVAMLALPFGALTTTTACGGANQQVVTTAIFTAQEVEATANTVVADIQATWPIVYALIPTSAQAAAQQAYNTALFTANQSILVLADAIQTAESLNQSNPDFTKAIQAVSDAVAQVIATIKQFTGAPAPAGASAAPTAGASAASRLDSDLATLKRVAGTK